MIILRLESGQLAAIHPGAITQVVEHGAGDMKRVHVSAMWGAGTRCMVSNFITLNSLEEIVSQIEHESLGDG